MNTYLKQWLRIDPLLILILLAAGVLQSCTTNLQGLASFELSLSSTSITVLQGQQASISVNIVAKNGFAGEVDLSAEGLPDGVTASFSKDTTTDTSTLTLSVSASAIGTEQIMIKGTSGLLEDNQILSLIIQAASTTGSLTISFNAPSDITPNVTITFPDGSHDHYSGDTSLSDLTPGTYIYEVIDIKNDLYTFEPDKSTAAVEVRAGETTTVTITYNPVDGALNFALDGPDELVVIDIEGPDFPPNAKTNTGETFSYLTPGVYTVGVHGGQTTLNGFLYEQVGDDVSVTVLPGELATATLNVEPKDGKLSIDFSGEGVLTAFTPAAIIYDALGNPIDGQAVTAPKTFTGLEPGSYTIEASEAMGGGKKYVPVAGQELQTVTVVAGEELSVTIAYEEKGDPPTITSFNDDACSLNGGTPCDGNIVRDAAQISGVLTYTALQWSITSEDPISLLLEPGAIDLTGLSFIELSNIELDGSAIEDGENIIYTLTASNKWGSSSSSFTLACCIPGIPDIMD